MCQKVGMLLEVEADIEVHTLKGQEDMDASDILQGRCGFLSSRACEHL